MTDILYLPEKFSLASLPLTVTDVSGRPLYELGAVDTVLIREWELQDLDGRMVCRLKRPLSWLGPWFSLEMADRSKVLIHLKPKREQAKLYPSRDFAYQLTGNIWAMNWRLEKGGQLLAKVSHHIKRAKPYYVIECYDDSCRHLVVGLTAAVDYVKGLLNED